MVRRQIDKALAQKYGQRGMVALDWKKAFDSINVESLLLALKRFGIPPKLVRIIQHVYSDRRFRVVGDASPSAERLQRSGISQGCPLSPFLFVILMSVVIQDSFDLLNKEDRERYSDGALDAVLYADDTLLLGSDSGSLPENLGQRC